MGDIMHSNNISAKPVNIVNQSLDMSKVELRKNPSNINLLDDMIGKYSSNTKMDCIELKRKFKKCMFWRSIFTEYFVKSSLS